MCRRICNALWFWRHCSMQCKQKSKAYLFLFVFGKGLFLLCCRWRRFLFSFKSSFTVFQSNNIFKYVQMLALALCERILIIIISVVKAQAQWNIAEQRTKAERRRDGQHYPGAQRGVVQTARYKCPIMSICLPPQQPLNLRFKIIVWAKRKALIF